MRQCLQKGPSLTGEVKLIQVNWNTVCGAMQDLPWRNIWSADNPVEVLNEHLLLICSRIIIISSSPGSLLICHSVAIRLRVLPPLPSGLVRSGISC